MISSNIRKSLGMAPRSIAVIATWGRGVAIITRALTGEGEGDLIPHRVVIDEAPVLLSSRMVAFLMETRTTGELQDVAEGLELAAAVFRSKGGASSLDLANRLSDQALQAGQGRIPRGNTVADKLLGVLRQLRKHTFSGEPKRDWIETRKQLKASGTGALASIAAHAEQLIVFQRGQHIPAKLSELWQNNGNYLGARRALDDALAEDLLLSGGDDLHGIHVMTIHKSKGKEFDAVVILDDSKNCPLVFCNEGGAYPRSRKLLRVGITRAKHHVMMLIPAVGGSRLLDGHKL